MKYVDVDEIGSAFSVSIAPLRGTKVQRYLEAGLPRTINISVYLAWK